MQKLLRTKRGLTLLELLVALVLSALIIAAIYRIFLGQHKTYAVQEQVVEMRQNARAAISNMMREMRMAGFGGVSEILPATFGSGLDAVICPNVVNANMPSTGWITVVTAVISDSRNPFLKSTPVQKGDSPKIEVKFPDGANVVVADLFDHDPTKGKNYISIGGVEAHRITNISGNQLTLGEKLLYKNKDYDPDDPSYRDPDDPKYNPNPTRVYPIRARSYYAGVRNENTGGNAQPTAENIESIQFEYLDAQGNPATSDAAVQMIRVRITATTDPTIRAADLLKDPKLPKTGDGLLKREITSNVQLRNVISSP
jgi:prepilin-type N-terminal cleavage/methylation domain-containing protein